MTSIKEVRVIRMKAKRANRKVPAAVHLHWEVACPVFMRPRIGPQNCDMCLCILYDVKERMLNLFPALSLTDVRLLEVPPALSPLRRMGCGNYAVFLFLHL